MGARKHRDAGGGYLLNRVDLGVGYRGQPRPSIFEHAHDPLNLQQIDVAVLVERRSDEDRLGRLLARRTDRERELLSLKYGAECTNREIARMTGLSESNVGTILHRAVQALRADWDGGV